MYYLEIACGENAHAALDYSLHYRSPHALGVDADYTMSRLYRSEGWPSFVVVDQSGTVRFHGFPQAMKLTGLRRCLDDLLAAPVTSDAPPAVLEQGIAIPPDVIAARHASRDRSPKLAFDPEGNPHVIYSSNRGGTNAVYLRRYNPQGEAVQEECLNPQGEESYAPDSVSDSQRNLWVTWCGRRQGKYDIFIHSRAQGKLPTTQQLSFSAEDAMSPKIAAGPAGAVTVVYYKWHSLWGTSRDRDIFGRTYDPVRGEWGKEIQISPPEPEVDDHTDPDVVMDAKGNAWTVWSYDYHPSLYKNALDAAQPTIFAVCSASNAVSAPILVGATGPLRYAVDLFPSAAVDARGVLWCAWDCSEPHRTIRLARMSQTGRQFDLVGTWEKNVEVSSTPELVSTLDDRLLLAFSQCLPNGVWQGKVVLVKEGQPVAQVTLSAPADVLFPQAQQSSKGDYWVAYETADAQSSKTVLRNITDELARSQREKAAAGL